MLLYISFTSTTIHYIIWLRIVQIWLHELIFSSLTFFLIFFLYGIQFTALHLNYACRNRLRLSYTNHFSCWFNERFKFFCLLLLFRFHFEYILPSNVVDLSFLTKFVNHNKGNEDAVDKPCKPDQSYNEISNFFDIGVY